MERWEKIHQIAAADEEYQKLQVSYEMAKLRFTRFADKKPGWIRKLLLSYPGMGYFMHHRMLELICEHKRFEDEQ